MVDLWLSVGMNALEVGCRGGLVVGGAWRGTTINVRRGGSFCVKRTVVSGLLNFLQAYGWTVRSLRLGSTLRVA